MRRLILTFTCFFISLGAAIAQDSRLENIVAMVQTNRVSASVECKAFVAESSTPVTIKADILAQGDCYYAESFGYRIYCNGTTRWTVDSENKEVYIEKAGGIMELADFIHMVEDLQIKKLQQSALSEDLSAFIFNTEGLGKEWIITDLRQE